MKAKYLLIAMVALSIVGMFTSSTYAKIDPKICVGMWLLDDNKGDTASDSSGSKNDGKLMNGPKWVTGKFGKALQFDGVNQYVDCGNDPSLDLTKNFTIVAWINFEDPKHAYDYAQVVARTDGGGQGGVEFGVCPGTGKLFTTNGPATVRSNTSLNKDEWYHVSSVYSGNNLTFYVNGEVDGGGNITFPSSNLATGIGRVPARDLLAYKGIIDDVAVFTEALTQDNVKSIMTRGLNVALGMIAVEPSGKLATTWAALRK
jgi:hypothetical protein